MARYEPDGTIRVVAAWTSAGAAGPSPPAGTDRVEAIGGRIFPNSPSGVGTGVEITLPLGHPGSPVPGS